MNDPLRGARRFDPTATDTGGTDEAATELTARRDFGADAPVLATAEVAPADAAVEAALAPRPRRRALLLLIAAVALLATAELALTIVTAWQVGSVLAIGWSVLGLAAVAGVGRVLWRELRRLRHLRRHVALREGADALRASDGSGASQALCEALRKAGQIATDDLRWQAFRHGDQPHHSDRERLQRYARQVLSPADSDARRLVTRAATDVALVVAVSPLAWVDMAMMGWRTTRLLDRMARLYGLELGYSARMRLFRSLLTNMALAGAGELASDLAADLVALGVAGKVSTRLAQGLAAGLLTARFGLQAMALCRPLPFEGDDRPRIAELRSELLAQLRRVALSKGEVDAMAERLERETTTPS